MEAILLALILCRITEPYECIRCDVPRYKLLAYGDEYFLDTTDGTIIDFNYAHDRKWAAKREEGIRKADKYLDDLSYISALHQAEAEYLEETLLDRKQWYEEGSDFWDIDYTNLGIHDSQAANRVREQILSKTITKTQNNKDGK